MSNRKRHRSEYSVFGRKILVLLGVVGLLLCTVLIGAASADSVGSCGKNLTWTLTDDGMLTISGTGEMTSHPWLAVPDAEERIKRVVIEEGVTTIAGWSFNDGKNIASVSLPQSLIAIEDGAFYGCKSLTSIIIPVNVKSIGVQAFYYCSKLSFIQIPDKLTSIGDYALGYKTTTGRVFANLDSDGARSVSKGGYSFRIPGTQFDLQYMTKSYSDDTIVGLQLTYCDKDAVSVAVPEGVTSIQMHAFSECIRLAEVTIPESVTDIGWDAFRDCDSLQEITIPGSVNSIEKDTFRNCDRLTSVTLCDGITSIGDSAFDGCVQLTSISMPDSITSIGSGAFSLCFGLEHVRLSENTLSIGSSAFGGCKSLTEIVIPDSVVSIGGGAFSSCHKLRKVILSNQLSSIEESVFYQCFKLADITIPESVTSIGFDAFMYCSSLKSIVIPENVTSVAMQAFIECDNLKTVTFLQDMNTAVNIDSYAFSWGTTLKIYCNEFSSAQQYAKARNWPVILLDKPNQSINRTVVLESDFRIPCGKSRRLKVTVFPDFPDLEWESSDPETVSVENGVITAQKAGTAIIKAKAGSKSDTVTITVYNKAQSYQLNVTEAWLVYNEKIKLSVVDTTPVGSGTDMIWRTLQPDFSKVDAKGTVTADKPGDVTILAEDFATGVRQKVLLHFCYPVTKVQLLSESSRIVPDQEMQLTAKIQMRTQSCENHLVTFSSSKTSVATVNQDGIVRGIAPGKTVITAKAASKISDSIEIEVVDGCCIMDGIVYGHDWGNAIYQWDKSKEKLMVTYTCSRNSNHQKAEPSGLRVLRLPVDLCVIETNAFAGIDSDAVIVPEGCLRIESGAFAGCRNLKYVWIPADMNEEDIAKDAFSGSTDAMIDFGE